MSNGHRITPPDPNIERLRAFWSRVDRSGKCWEWTGGLSSDGYGAFWNGTMSVGAHRFAYELQHGPIPAGLAPHKDAA